MVWADYGFYEDKFTKNYKIYEIHRHFWFMADNIKEQSLRTFKSLSTQLHSKIILCFLHWLAQKTFAINK